MDAKYGKRLGRDETHEIFPQNQFKSGVILEDQKVKYIKIVLSNAARYPNIVDENWIKYSKTPHAEAHATLLQGQDVFKIKVCVGSKDYFWGRGRVVSFSKDSNQYLIRRERTMDDVEPNDDEKGKIDRDIALALPASSPTVPPKSPQASPLPASPPTAPSSAPKHFGKRALYKGIEYDSITEAKMAIFFDTLKIPFTAHPFAVKLDKRRDTLENASKRARLALPTESGPAWGIQDAEFFHNYTVDFFIVTARNGPLMVEIKASFPSDEELWKCEALSSQWNCNVLLLYGMNFHVANYMTRYVESSTSGIKGILWEMNNGQKVTHDVVWMATSDENGKKEYFVGTRKKICDETIYDPKIIEAYKAAEECKITKSESPNRAGGDDVYILKAK